MDTIEALTKSEKLASELADLLDDIAINSELTTFSIKPAYAVLLTGSKFLLTNIRSLVVKLAIQRESKS